MEVDSKSFERKSRLQSAGVTIFIQLLLFLVLFFTVVWEKPNPPKPIYGLELNLGFSDFGSGNQSEVPTSATESPVIESPAPGEIAPPTTATVATTSSTVSKSKPSTNKAVSTQPSPIKGETVATPSFPKEEDKPTAQKEVEQPKIDQRAIFGSGGKSGKGTDPSSGLGQGNTSTAGDQGKPTGAVDGRALQGSGSGKGVASGAGYSLDLVGWEFAARPSINDRVSTRNGRIVFKITVDGSGKVVKSLPLEYNVSNEVLAYYRQVVNQLDFKKSVGAAADFSSGKITFVIQVD